MVPAPCAEAPAQPRAKGSIPPRNPGGSEPGLPPPMGADLRTCRVSNAVFLAPGFIFHVVLYLSCNYNLSAPGQVCGSCGRAARAVMLLEAGGARLN